MSEIYGVIMAGGGGTRFWPLSRRLVPKQLINLSGNDVMVNETIDRLSRVVRSENMYIVTNSAQAEGMEVATRSRLSAGNILKEPAARNTAACIGYAAVRLLKERGDGVMVVTPSDAYIRDAEEYARVLRAAIGRAESGDCLVTVGITPTFAATGYGYINFEQSEDPVKRVKRFVEKPEKSVAERYLAEGGYVWNSGVFVWRASAILKKFRQYLPDIYSELCKIGSAVGTPEEESVLAEVYPRIRPVSIDYGIMEKSDDICVVPGEFGWNDVGSWDMLGAVRPRDENGNVAVGDALLVDSANSTVYAGSRFVSVVGVQGLVVVETPDAVMVCPADRAQDVKKIVEELQRRGRDELL